MPNLYVLDLIKEKLFYSSSGTQNIILLYDLLWRLITINDWQESSIENKVF